MKQKYIELRNKYKDNPQAIYQQDFMMFLYNFYIDNGKKCGNAQEFVDGFFNEIKIVDMGGGRTFRSESSRDVSMVIPELDRYFELVTLHDIPQQDKTIGKLIKVIQ